MMKTISPLYHELGDGMGHSHNHDNIDSLTHEHMHEVGIAHSHDGQGHSHEHGEHGHVHSAESKKAVVNRLSRIIGHMQSVKTMVETDRDCSDVLIQLSAINSAVQSVSRVILKEHLSTCIIDAVQDGDYEAIDELNKAIDKFMK